jgi:short-subunit dehydrogenase
MSKFLVIAGCHGAGISHAVAKKFGKKYRVALISRSVGKLDEIVQKLKEEGVDAQAFHADLGNPVIVADTLKKIQVFGSVEILFWNVGGLAKPLIQSSVSDMELNLNVTVVSLVQAIKTIQDDLEANHGAVLVTGGGFGAERSPAQYVVSLGCGSLAMNKAALHKACAILHEELKPKGIFVGEVMVASIVKGTAWDNGNAKLEADDVAKAFEELLQKRIEGFFLLA